MLSLSRPAQRCAVVVLFVFATITISGNALANSGVQLPLSSYGAGSEMTTAGPITNAGFESANGANVPTGWTPTSPVMTSGAPDPANLPIPATVVGTRSAQARQAGGISSLQDYFLNQTVTLQPETDYVLSAYIWNYAFAGPNPPTDFNAGDLAVVQLRDSENFFNTAGLILERTAKDSGDGARGYFVYKTFNSSRFASPTVGLEVNFDPNQDVQLGVPRPELSAQWDAISLTPLATFSSQRFTNAAGGAWTSAANWQNGVPNTASAVASFLATSAGAAPVNLGAGTVTVAVINFDALGGYAISGGTLGLDHEERDESVIINNLRGNNSITSPIVVGVGTVNLGGVVLVPRPVRFHVAGAADVLSVTGGMTAENVPTLGVGTLDVTKNGAGRLDTRAFVARVLKIDAGTLRMPLGNTAADRISAETLTIAGDAAPTAKLDLTNNAFVLNYGTMATSPLPLIKQQILAGYAGGSFTGNGITTSRGAGYAVGYAEASQLGSVPAIFGTVDSTTILLRGTLAGDTNLDGTVNISDFSVLASNFNLPGEWFKGDFNYDGMTNISDFSQLSANFNRSVTGSLPRAVPEPSSAIVLLAFATVLRRAARA